MVPTENTKPERKVRKAHKDRGKGGLKEDLMEEYNSRSEFHLNSWQSALYLGLTESEEFLAVNWVL